VAVHVAWAHRLFTPDPTDSMSKILRRLKRHRRASDRRSPRRIGLRAVPV